MDDGWYDSYIMGAHGNLYFFMVIEKGISACLTDFNRSVEIGSFYKVKIGKNNEARPYMRAKHQVIQYKKRDPLAEVRVELDSKGTAHVHLTTIAEVTKYVSDRGYEVAFLQNNVFGNFVDLERLIPKGEKVVEFEFKCKASPRNEFQSVFVPTKIIRCIANSSLKRIVGFVYFDRKYQEHYIWTKDTRNDVRLDPRYKPDGNVLSLWVEAVVNEESNQLTEVAKIIPDVYPSRVRNEDAEVFVSFTFDSFDDYNGYYVYFNSYFLFIADPDRLIQQGRRGDEITGWIRRFNGQQGHEWAISRIEGINVFSNETSSSSEMGGHRDSFWPEKEFSNVQRPPRQHSPTAPPRREVYSPINRPLSRALTSDDSYASVSERDEPVIISGRRPASSSSSEIIFSSDEDDVHVRPEQSEIYPQMQNSRQRRDSSFSRNGFSSNEEDCVPATRRETSNGGSGAESLVENTNVSIECIPGNIYQQHSAHSSQPPHPAYQSTESVNDQMFIDFQNIRVEEPMKAQIGRTKEQETKNLRKARAMAERASDILSQICNDETRDRMQRHNNENYLEMIEIFKTWANKNI